MLILITQMKEGAYLNLNSVTILRNKIKRQVKKSQGKFQVVFSTLIVYNGGKLLLLTQIVCR